MAINNINLRKLLRLFYMKPNELTSKLREDIRNENAKKDGTQKPGGDFYAPFWSDAKDHVAGISDLTTQTDIRIEKNYGRRHLYPLLRASFLEWWNEKRRWSNQAFEVLPISIKGNYEPQGLDAIVKVENILALRIDDNTHRIIYPYFSQEPQLQAEGARIGLWVLGNTLDEYRIEDMRILDVFQPNSYSTSEHPLQGNEEELFLTKYSHILEKWESLKEEY